MFLDPANKGKILKKMGWKDAWVEIAKQNFDIAYNLYEQKYGSTVQERPLKRIKKYDADYKAWNEQF